MATETLTHTGKDGKGILITEPAMKQLANLMQQQAAAVCFGWACAQAAAAA